MIKCGKLKGKDGEAADQCILYTKDGSKVLGRFPYSEHGGEKGAKAAAHKREGQVQFFKQKHKGLLDAIDAFGAPVVLKYLLDKAEGCEACQEVVKSYVEKARGEGQGQGGPRQGDGGADKCVCPECGKEMAHEKGKPCSEVACPECGAAMRGQSAEKSVEKAEKKRPSFKEAWEKDYGGSVTNCMKRVAEKVSDPGAYCAWLKDHVTGTTKWRGKEKEKSFTETAEEALTMLEKDENDTMIDLRELERWLEGKAGNDGDSTEPAASAEPEPTEPEPEPEPVEELPNDFRTFLLQEHAQRRAGVLAMLGEEVTDG